MVTIVTENLGVSTRSLSGKSFAQLLTGGFPKSYLKRWRLLEGSKNYSCRFPKVCVIIPNWNGEKYLRNCLSSLQDQTYPNYEVILVDNGSTDNSVKYLREKFPNVKIIKLNKNMGYSVAINSGLEQSNSKYAVVLNNDTTVEPNWLLELVTVAESDERIGSCQPKILSQSDPTVIDAVGLLINKDGVAWQEGCQTKDTGQFDEIKEVIGACSASVLYLRRALSQIGMFDSDFFVLYDDVDVALRLKIAGWKCMYVPSAIVYHIGSASVKVNSPFRTYLLQRNNYFYRIKNFPKINLVEFLIQRLMSVPLDSFMFCINTRALLVPYLKGNLDGIKGFAKMYKKRPRILFSLN
jgi:hypothetical protein